MNRAHASLAITTAVLLCLSATSAMATDSDGMALFTKNKCGMCHSVASAGVEAKIKVEKMRGPDLGGTTVSDDGLLEFMRKKVERNGQLHKNEFKGTDEEFRALLAWLRAQAPA